MSLYYNVPVTLHYTSSWCSIKSHILDTDSSEMRRNESNRQTLGISPNVSALEFEFKTSKHLFEEKNVFYSFDSIQIVRVLISVDYILHIIKSKILLPPSGIGALAECDYSV